MGHVWGASDLDLLEKRISPGASRSDHLISQVRLARIHVLRETGDRLSEAAELLTNNAKDKALPRAAPLQGMYQTLCQMDKALKSLCESVDIQASADKAKRMRAAKKALAKERLDRVQAELAALLPGKKSILKERIRVAAPRSTEPTAEGDSRVILLLQSRNR